MCYHIRNLDRSKQWYWGYVHANGTIKVKSLNITHSGHQCDFCHACDGHDSGNSFIQMVLQPMSATNSMSALRVYAESLPNAEKNGSVMLTAKDRFELIELE